MSIKKRIIGSLLVVGALFSTMTFAHNGPAMGRHAPNNHQAYPAHPQPMRGGFHPRMPERQVVVINQRHHHPHFSMFRHHRPMVLFRFGRR